MQVSSISYIFESILVASVIAAVLAWFSIRLARRAGLLDVPNSAPHKLHQAPIPLAGGLALAGSLIFGSLIYRTYRDPGVTATFLACIPVFLFGLLDDYKRISPIVKLLGQSLAVVILIASGISVKVLESPEFFFGGNGAINVYLDWLLTYLWIVGITNAFNFVDSMDGLAVGLAGMATAFFTLVTLNDNQLDLSRHSALLLGTCIGLFLFNMPPARLFLGDSGAQTLGTALAVLAIAYRPQDAEQSSSWLVPIMLLGVPIFDMILVVFSRLRRKKPVYSASRDHTYHRLIAFGWNSNQAVLLMQVTSLLLGCLAFLVLTRSPIVANSIFLVVIVAGICAFVYFDSHKRWA
jgi:UDP-GlcNAc:undecaprenyl-phosphate GlcNAc-1-phosphate transferase